MIQQVGTVTDRGYRIMRLCSYCTVLSSYGFAVAYASHPSIIQKTLFGVLAIHWTWAIIQASLGTGIILASLRGGYHMQLAHSIGFIVQTIYCSLWIASAITTGNGWFVWPGVFFLAVAHFVLSRLKWRKRNAERGTGSV